jgi:hypothetical protein
MPRWSWVPEQCAVRGRFLLAVAHVPRVHHPDHLCAVLVHSCAVDQAQLPRHARSRVVASAIHFPLHLVPLASMVSIGICRVPSTCVHRKRVRSPIAAPALPVTPSRVPSAIRATLCSLDRALRSAAALSLQRAPPAPHRRATHAIP